MVEGASKQPQRAELGWKEAISHSAYLPMAMPQPLRKKRVTAEGWEGEMACGGGIERTGTSRPDLGLWSLGWHQGRGGSFGNFEGVIPCPVSDSRAPPRKIRTG